jgi:hypothetical protein
MRAVAPLLVIVLLCSAATLASQPVRARRSRHAPALGAGGALMLVQPRNDFAEHVHGGGGLALQGVLGVDRYGIVGLRADAHEIVYGWASQSDTTLRNVIRTGTIGPELTLPLGPIRPYAAGSVGLAYLATELDYDCLPVRECSDDDVDDRDERASATRLPRLTVAWARRLGVRLRLWRDRRSGMAYSLDFGVSEQGNGRTRYLRANDPRSIVGKTQYRVYQVGVSVARE